jgi:4'-phosphopantetheinyl transferase
VTSFASGGVHGQAPASRTALADVVAGDDPAEDRAVIVWRVRLDSADRPSQRLVGDLALDEVERLRRLGGSGIAWRWLASRAALRGILGLELGVSPSQVRLKVGAHGRPCLDPEIHDTELDFNLSHSADLALVATARSLRMGVDVERLRRRRDPLRVADRYFSPAEAGALRAFPQTDHPAAFFCHWTAKEALAKGLGLGLEAPRGKLELAQRADGTMVPLRLGRDWRIAALPDLPSGYFGALAVQGGPPSIRMRDWPLDRVDEAPAGPAEPLSAQRQRNPSG